MVPAEIEHEMNFARPSRNTLTHFAVIVISASPAYARTILVPAEIPSIGAAMAAAAGGDTVLVAPGVYTNCDDGPCRPNVAVLKPGVSLVSEAGPAATVLRVDEAFGGAYSVVFGSGIGTVGALLEEFTIAATASNYRGLAVLSCDSIRVRNCIFEEIDPGAESGAGVFSNGSSTNFAETKFRRCRATQSGSAIWGINSSVTMVSCEVTDNRQGGPVVLDGGFGGEFYIWDCLFADNVGVNAGALTITDGSVVELRGNVFVNNETEFGSCVTVMNLADELSWFATAERNVFVGNRSDRANGGLLWNYRGTVRNNLFYGNYGLNNSGLSDYETPMHQRMIRNNIFARGAGGPCLSSFGPGAPPNSACSVFWDNEGGDFEGYEPGRSDLFVDPEFCAADVGDFTLRASSPCLPENSLSCDQIGPFGQGCGTVTLKPQSWGRIKGRYRGVD